MARTLSIITALLFVLGCASATPFSFSMNPGYHKSASHRSSHGDITTKHRLEGKTIAEVLRGKERFSKLMKAFESHSNLRDDLDSKDRKLVLLAPTNEAFEELEKLPEKPNIELESVLNYHMIEHESHVADRDNWFNGMLFETRLRENKLGDKNQVVRLGKTLGRWSLNFYAQIEEIEYETDNGIIFVLDRVLLPPVDIYNTMRMIPVEFSTFTQAVSESKTIRNKLEQGDSWSVFLPTNRAWQKLGMKNLVYLFSETGKKDLEKILSYCVATELLYTHEIKKKESLKTLEGEKLDLEVVTMKGGKKHHGKTRGHHAMKHHILVNEWARVIINDLPCENGVINVVDEVLLPENIELPEEPFAASE